jgi:hypothetical protein
MGIEPVTRESYRCDSLEALCRSLVPRTFAYIVQLVTCIFGDHTDATGSVFFSTRNAARSLLLVRQPH